MQMIGISAVHLIANLLQEKPVPCFKDFACYLEVDSNFAAGSRAALLHHCLNS